MDTSGLLWREVPRSERPALLKTGHAYLEEGSPLQALDPDLAPGETLAKVEVDERAIYEELEEPVARELESTSVRLVPAQLKDGGRTYAWWPTANAAARARTRVAASPPPDSGSGSGFRRVFRIRYADRPGTGPIAPLKTERSGDAATASCGL
jgi:hypothetical protein